MLGGQGRKMEGWGWVPGGSCVRSRGTATLAGPEDASRVSAHGWFPRQANRVPKGRAGSVLPRSMAVSRLLSSLVASLVITSTWHDVLLQPV